MGKHRTRRWGGLALAVAYGTAVGVMATASGRQPRAHPTPPPPPERRGRKRAGIGIVVLLAVGGLWGGLAVASGSDDQPGTDGLILAGSRAGTDSAPKPSAYRRPLPSATPAPTHDPPTAAEVAVAVARDQLGKPYRWAATGPSAFDCSGLTSFAWRAAGVELPRTSRAQFASLPRVPPDRLKPGDLVYSPGHIGMFIGEGQMIHAPLSGRDVEVAPLRQPMTGAVRPAPTDMPAA